MSRNDNRYPDGFSEFLGFLCNKYRVDSRRVFIDYNSSPPPPLRGNRLGYYDGLLSYRRKDGRLEFLITVFKIAQDPLLTLAHEFAHLVDDLQRGGPNTYLAPPNPEREEQFDEWAMRDLTEFQTQRPEDSSS